MITLRVFFAVILLPTCAWSATPIITGRTSGILSTGQIVTISGSSLVDEDKTNWATAYKTGTKYGFEGASWSADNYHAPGGDNNISYDSSVKIMGNQSFQGRIYGTSVTCPTDNKGAYAVAYLGEDGLDEQQRDDFYVRMYSRWHTSGAGDLWPKSHIKMLDVQGEGAQMYFQPSASSSGTLPSTVNMVYDGTNHEYSAANFLQQDRWYVMEARFKRSNPANFTAWVDGVQINSVTPINVGSDYNMVLFNIINACAFTDLDLTNWTDGLTISKSRIYPASKIEISNNAVYGSGTVKYQEPIYLSDESVQFKVDLSGLGSGPYYLWVTNNRQERSSGFLFGQVGSILPFTHDGKPIRSPQ